MTTIILYTSMYPAVSLGMMKQRSMEIPGKDGRSSGKVWKELCYGKAGILGDVEPLARQWQYDVL